MDFSLMKEFMDRLTAWRIPGNTVVVYHKNKEVFRCSSGYSDVESGTPMTGDELLNIYSCSKVATVTAAMQLYEKGLFLLDDPLYDFIPEYRHMYIRGENGELTKAEKPITMRHLFTMTAGLTYNTKSENLIKGREETGGRMPTVEAAKYIAADPLVFEPGSRWEYSLCHDVLAAAVEVISGRKFSDYAIKNIFEPVGAKNVFYHRTPEIMQKMASQYEYITDTSAVIDAVEAQISSGNKQGVCIKKDKSIGFELGTEYDSGGAGITVSVPDYAKFTDALANGGRAATGERILSPGTIELMRTNQLTAAQSVTFTWKQHTGYGYGLGVRTMLDRAKSGSNGSIGEFGWAGAAGAAVICDPDTGLSCFYAHHMLNPHEEYYMPRLRNTLYTCMGR